MQVYHKVASVLGRALPVACDIPETEHMTIATYAEEHENEETKNEIQQA